VVTEGAKKQLGWGLIGASDIAATYMIPAIRADPRSEIVGVSSRSAQRAASYAGEHEIPAAFSSHRELLADDGVDVVYISSVNSLHHRQALDAAAAGKHALCEKPMALSSEDAREMVDAFAERDLVLGVNHHLRNASANRAARDAIRDGEIGRPLSARALQAADLAERLQTWRLNDPAAGAGVTLDITVHDVDLLRFVLGDDVVEVNSLTANQGLAATGIEDAVVGCLRFRSGLLATVHDAFNVADARTSLEVYGSEGAILVTDAMADDPIASALLRKGGESRPLAMEAQGDLYERGVAGFTAAVLDGSAPVATGEDGARSLEVALAILEAAGSSTSVSLPPERS
jgi:1,5-anhydro-D-fructose reductase (1,5-anhydro-D-mannitol-forming)